MPANLCLEVVDNTTFLVNEIEPAGATDLVNLWSTNNAMPAGPTPSATTGEFEIMGTTFTATGTAGQYSTENAIPAYVEPPVPAPSFSGLQLPFLMEYEDADTRSINVSPDTTVFDFVNHLSVTVRKEGGNEVELTRTVGTGSNNMPSLRFRNEELGVYLTVDRWSDDGTTIEDDSSQVCDSFVISYQNMSLSELNYELVSFDWI